MSLLFSILSFLLPFQLGFHVNTSQVSVYGFKIDYLIPTVYLSDIIAIVIIFVFFVKKKFKLNVRNYVFSLMFLIFVIINVLHSQLIIPSIYKWLKISEMILLGMIIYKYKKFKIFDNFIKPLSYSLFVCLLLGILQFINKGSIGGIFYWLGERSLRFSDANVSPFPYSTFSHSNSFAGFLLIFGIFLLLFKNKFNRNYFYVISILLGINLILTNSMNIYFTMGLLLILKIKSNLTFNFMMINISQRFITHRLELIKASLSMIKSNFLFGVGLNNFVPNLVKVSNTFINAWELQPVHNIFLLVFSETGFIGLLSFITLLFFTLSTYNFPLIAILLTGMSDHYWLTLQQNMLLFTIVLSTSFKHLYK